MFVESAELYDAIYHFKDYPRECQRLHAIINQAVPDARTILDVACGTGEHAKFLKGVYAIDGVDINRDYLRAARLKNPSGTYSCADMTEFDLGRTYDVVTCLFSAIGNVKTIERLESAVDHMARHVKPEGVLIIEPWFSPDQWNPSHVFIHTGEMPDGKVCRMSLSRREGNLSVLDFHYLHGKTQGITAYSERLVLGLFTRTEMTQAFVAAGMDVSYDPDGLMGRGLYIGRQLF